MKRGRKGRLYTLEVNYLLKDELDWSVHPALRAAPRANDFLRVRATFKNKESFTFDVAWSRDVRVFILEDGKLVGFEPMIPNHEKDEPLVTEIIYETFRREAWQRFAHLAAECNKLADTPPEED